MHEHAVHKEPAPYAEAGRGGPPPHDHARHHEHMVADFRKRFWISLAVTVPILLLSPMIQDFLGLRDVLKFRGDLYVLFALSSFVYFYGGWPFLKGLQAVITFRVSDIEPMRYLGNDGRKGSEVPLSSLNGLHPLS